MAKIFTYRGFTLEDLKKMSLEDFAKVANAEVRRKLLRRMPEKHKKLLLRSRKTSAPLKTHCRDMIILPEFIGKQFNVHNGKEFIPVRVEPDMIGHYLSEFALSRKRVQHSAPGMGATRASKYVSLK
ncbi:TPA: 30S ribosomal protein S19 [archaeon]|uniref:Small ribosomal subunit protein uS19 n=1 Tax=Candidatus Naiadarchaeum limnaeum TaxID=2756139 RepID=A0A832V073_9ARCH|nr:30S ribosomal protein S19 [Candidatus Naiadarchaeales archaeon SRR2090153.bin1042]HIK00484.1 30S ribosomal protein S19 [Candidatus Naiadarchaeum limnaeum]